MISAFDTAILIALIASLILNIILVICLTSSKSDLAEVALSSTRQGIVMGRETMKDTIVFGRQTLVELERHADEVQLPLPFLNDDDDDRGIVSDLSH